MKKPAFDRQWSEVGKGRLEFLFDGVFAIAMTLLVLELKIPDLGDRRSTSELLAGLGRHAPTFISYLLSFFMLGMFWASHNIWYRHLQRITNGVFAFQLIQMALAAFFPFCAALLGKYPTNPLTIVIYVGCVAAYLWAATIQWAVARRAGALAPPPDPALYRRIRRTQLAGSLGTTFLFLLYAFQALLK